MSNSGAPNQVYATAVQNVYADQIDTPRVVMRASDHAMRWRWDGADPFGTLQPDGNPASLGTYVQNLRFPGQYYDQESNLHYNYHRDYDPRIGRYVQSDPIGLNGGVNTYAYVGGNPLSGIDPSGLAVYLSGHLAGGVAGFWTEPPSYHFSIVLRPDNPGDFADATGWKRDKYGLFATLGAGPSFDLNLVSKPNVTGDRPSNGSFWIDVQTPTGMTDTQFINRLIKAANCYRNDKPYSKPGRNGVMPTARYNSNSFVSGVIKAAGGMPPDVPVGVGFQMPGYGNPLSISSDCACNGP